MAQRIRAKEAPRIATISGDDRRARRRRRISAAAFSLAASSVIEVATRPPFLHTRAKRASCAPAHKYCDANRRPIKNRRSRFASKIGGFNSCNARARAIIIAVAASRQSALSKIARELQNSAASRSRARAVAAAVVAADHNGGKKIASGDTKTRRTPSSRRAAPRS